MLQPEKLVNTCNRKIYDSIQKARTVYNGLLAYSYEKRHFFICTFNDIKTNFHYEKEPPCIHVPSYIEFITVEPGSQTPIGSFHPVHDNFYQIAYSKPNLDQIIYKSNISIVWMKSTFEDRSSEGSSHDRYSKKDDTVAKYILINDYQSWGRAKRRDPVWFETYSPSVSAAIEHAFRIFLCFKTDCAEYHVNDHEIIDFYTWSVKYGPYHPTYPNQSSLLYRDILHCLEEESSTNSDTSSNEDGNDKKPSRLSIHSYY